MRSLALVSAVVLLAAGCGGGSTPGAASASRRALAFSRCMRAHGVPRFPDPGPDGTIAKPALEQTGAGAVATGRAVTACHSLLPNGGEAPTAAGLQQSWTDFRAFARCMRGHGVAGWPDPTRYPQHPERPTFDLQAAGIDPASPRIRADADACLPLLHGENPQRLG